MPDSPERPHASPDGDPPARTTDPVLAGGGELGARMRAFDWSSTPLGPPETWPQSLKTCVRIMLTSRQPIWIGWGPELTYLYNDPYKAIIGGKHPAALGRPTSVVWREIWDVIDPMLATAMAGDEGTYVESQLLIMERYGYEEETYYTFSYSPVPNEQGGTGGIICANTDDTKRVVGERQMALLRELAARTADARTVADVCARSAEALTTNARDLPFALIYLLDPDDRHTARLAGAAGIEAGHPAAPAVVSPEVTSVWPFAAVARTHEAAVVDLGDGFGALPAGAWSRPPAKAAVLPVAPSGERGRAGFLVVGLNPFRLFDQDYRGFLGLVSGQLSAGIANAEAYQEEKKRAEALAELDRAKTAFFSNVSHEFRTPLTLMLGPIEDLLAGRAGPLEPDQQRELDVAHRNSVRLLRLVNMLLDFSRIEAGRIQAVYEPTDLAAYTADLASTFRSTIERAGLRLVVETPALPEPTFVDREMWEKIVLNLLSNAFKFTLEGEIAVSLQAAPGAVTLAVRDTGTGIPPEELPHVFERFHRVRGTPGRTHEGTGIGLALVQELVRLHGGTASVESTPGVGSTFRVTIPTGSAHLPADRIGAQRALASTAMGAAPYVEEARRWQPARQEDPPLLPGGAGTILPPPDGAHADARILLADDNTDMRDYVARLLVQQHYRVEAVPNGAAALEAARRERPDLVLSDVMMPEMDGFELLEALRDDPQTRDVPILLLSARAGEEARVEGLEAGADDYLTKPFSARELIARVGTHLELARMRRTTAAAVEAERDRLHAEVAERKRVEEALRRTEAQFRNMADNAPVMIWVTEPDGTCTYLSKSWYEFTGQTPETGLGLGWVEATHPDDRDRTAQSFLAANARHEGFRFEYRLRRKDGAYRWAIDSAVPRFDSGGAFLGYIGSVIDITERKEAEDVLQRLNETLEHQVAERTAELERANDELRRSNRELQDFAYVASHDLQEPLRKITTFTDLLRIDYGHAVDETGLSYMQRMQDAALRMSGLLRDLLAFSRVATRGEPFQQVDLEGILASVLSDLEVSIAEADGTVEVEPLPSLEADPMQMRQLFQNLVGNALKFHREGVPPVVRVSATLERSAGSDEPATCRIVVADNGIGFAERYLDRLFAPFQRLHGKSAYPGTGMGLAICRRIVERHGGAITARSTPGTGASFIVTLPVRHDRGEA